MNADRDYGRQLRPVLASSVRPSRSPIVLLGIDRAARGRLLPAGRQQAAAAGLGRWLAGCSGPPSRGLRSLESLVQAIGVVPSLGENRGRQFPIDQHNLARARPSPRWALITAIPPAIRHAFSCGVALAEQVEDFLAGVVIGDRAREDLCLRQREDLRRGANAACRRI